MLLTIATMKPSKSKSAVERESVLRDLQRAIIAGASWQYDRLIALATAAGVTAEEIDIVATEAVRSLLTGAEQPLTGRKLAQVWPGGRPGS